jgi:hypothetical protein
MTRMRSPNYPALTLEEAVHATKALWDKNRCTTVSREAVAKDLGYSGLTGRSLQVLGALNQYGLTENVAKGHMRVTKTGEEALIGYPEEIRRRAISRASRSPTFFGEIYAQFDGSVPGENAVRFFLLQKGFTNDGVEKALRVFADTNRFAEVNGDSESYGKAAGGGADSTSVEMTQEEDIMATAPAPQPSGPPVAAFAYASGALDFSLSSSGLAVAGKANSRKAVNDFADKLKALAALLPDDDNDD